MYDEDRCVYLTEIGRWNKTKGSVMMYELVGLSLYPSWPPFPKTENWPVKLLLWRSAVITACDILWGQWAILKTGPFLIRIVKGNGYYIPYIHGNIHTFDLYVDIWNLMEILQFRVKVFIDYFARHFAFISSCMSHNTIEQVFALG